uniref:Protein artemis n=1 Tax=Trichuris muris TaxID=70415 RepID=A0A5S6QXF2_TRIMR
MSTFNGIIAEYDFISVDRFCNQALQASAFFLSHFHSDHTIGLQSDSFFEKLRFSRATLFMHKATFELLLSDQHCKRLKPYIKSWETNVPFLVYATDDQSARSVTVTLLPGGHCFGSVMFLFEGPEGPVLYTGDERVSLSDWKNFPLLHIGSEVKLLTCLYFDSTFCTPHTRHFPSRWEAVKAASEVAADWLKENSENRVLLRCPYMYGYEFFFCQLSKRIKQKIHVDENFLRAYKASADILSSLTDRFGETRVHLFIPSESEYDGGRKYGSFRTCLPFVSDNSTVLTLKPSVMWFAARKNTKCVKYFTSRTFCRILYSNHSSMDEVVEMVSYLKPKRLCPCVLPRDYSVHCFQQFLISSPLGQFQLNFSHCLCSTTTFRSAGCKNGPTRHRSDKQRYVGVLPRIDDKASTASYIHCRSSELHESCENLTALSSK